MSTFTIGWFTCSKNDGEVDRAEEEKRRQHEKVNDMKRLPIGIKIMPSEKRRPRKSYA